MYALLKAEQAKTGMNDAAVVAGIGHPGAMAGAASGRRGGIAR